MGDNTIINVPGVGYIGQYDSWLSMLQQGDMGILYFFRDYYYAKIQALLEGSENCPHIRDYVLRLNHLNKVLSDHERLHGFPYPTAPAKPMGR